MSRSGEHSFERFNSFLEKKADAAIAFDGLGIKDRIFVELWDSMNTLAINILMDHPLRFLSQQNCMYLLGCLNIVG